MLAGATAVVTRKRADALVHAHRSCAPTTRSVGRYPI